MTLRFNLSQDAFVILVALFVGRVFGLSFRRAPFS